MDSFVGELAEARTDLEAAVADQLATLSEASKAPREVALPAELLDSKAISFSSAEWMADLCSVQGWLKLDIPLTPGASLDEPLAHLTEQLATSEERPEQLVELGGSFPVLSVAGLDRLRARCDRAIELQRDFLADLEGEGGSLAAATRRWREAWEEAPEVEEENSGPVTARTHVWPIQEFGDMAERGKLNLSPSYQRGDVWPTTDAQMLIESILRGIPLPSVIVLKPSNQFDAPFEVVDGKQRLTSILRFIGRHPGAADVIDRAEALHPDAGLKRLFREDYPAFRRAWKNVVGEQLTATVERDYYFPFKLRTNSPALRGELAEFQGRYYSQIRNRPINIADELVEVAQIFERVSAYKIPVIEYSRATRRQIHEVFNLYNKQGKHLNAEEIRNALYHNLSLMRALLVSAGDSGADDPNMRFEVAPFLREPWDLIDHVGDTLKQFEFGVSRYRRTKVLSWLAATVVVEQPPGQEPKIPSTARHIDALLDRVEEATADPLRNDRRVADLMAFLANAISAHAATPSAWAAIFMDGANGTKWQELPLISSLAGVCIASAVLGDDIEDALADNAETLQNLSGSDAWQRPDNTQTQSQWRYTAKIAIWVVRALGVDLDEAHAAIRARFGSSAVSTLEGIYEHDPLTAHEREGAGYSTNDRGATGR
ncbi:DUF262 domain-containing protein [Nocardioides sp. AX2bis]|uniref:DUF262 domain-containing protein n=1 Tax=Nocardioides sp. AX2bis TaxID=2653157 RepID=UPI001358A9EE|nr:DUF262 domain-containing protein [Nocardioides sp. AX2bis]